MLKVCEIYSINGVEVSENNYNWYKFLTKDNNDLEMLFNIILDENAFIGKAIIKFQEHIRQSRNIDFDEIVKVCRDKDTLECKTILEELFLEEIDIKSIAAKMNRQGWNLENLIKEHQKNPNKRIHRMLNIPYSTYVGMKL